MFHSNPFRGRYIRMVWSAFWGHFAVLLSMVTWGYCKIDKIIIMRKLWWRCCWLSLMSSIKFVIDWMDKLIKLYKSQNFILNMWFYTKYVARIILQYLIFLNTWILTPYPRRWVGPSHSYAYTSQWAKNW